MTAFESELEKQIVAEIEDLKKNFAAGQMKRKQYHHTVGRIHAYTAVIDMIPEIRKKLNEA